MEVVAGGDGVGDGVDDGGDDPAAAAGRQGVVAVDAAVGFPQRDCCCSIGAQGKRIRRHTGNREEKTCEKCSDGKKVPFFTLKSKAIPCVYLDSSSFVSLSRRKSYMG